MTSKSRCVRKVDRRKKKIQRSEDDIIFEITQKTQDLAEVQNELKNFKGMWSNIIAEEDTSPRFQKAPPSVASNIQYATSTFNSRDAPKALSAIQAMEDKCKLIQESFK